MILSGDGGDDAEQEEEAEEGAADPVPAQPKTAVDEPATTLTLVPYAVAKLRITSFPVIAAPS